MGMYKSTLLTVFLELVCVIVVARSATLISSGEQSKPVRLNEEPIIGVLAQEMSYSLANKYEDDYESYIAASYVKFIEGAGARVVPIW